MIRIPGKIMLLGEYAALSGGSALAATVNRELNLSWEEDGQRSLTARSTFWTRDFRFETPEDIFNLRDAYPKEVALDHLAFLWQKYALWKSGAITIESSILPTDGFGSSSALRLALTAEFLKCDVKNAVEPAFAAQNAFQKGKASGYDVATQATGGLCFYQKKSDALMKNIEQLAIKPPITVTVFSGNSGDATAESVNEKRPQLETNTEFLQASERSVDLFLAKVFEAEKFISSVAVLLNNFLALLPRFPQGVFWDLRHIEGFGNSWVVKTTGAGGLDALIGFGAIPKDALEAIEQHGWKDSNVELAL